MKTGFLVIGLSLLIGFGAQSAPRIISTIGTTQRAVCLAPLGQALWVGTTAAGLVRIDGGESRIFSVREGLPGAEVKDCASSASTLFAATRTGIARFNDHTGRFEAVARGRFSRLAATRETVYAADDTGRYFELTPAPRLLGRVDFVPSAMAVSPTGQIALGNIDGQLVIGGMRRRLAAPVLDLKYTDAGLNVLTAQGGFRVDGTRLIPWSAADSRAQALDEAGRPFADPRFTGLLVTAVAQAGDDLFAATDGGLFKRRGDPAKGWHPVLLGGMPCGPRLTGLAEFGGALWVGSFDNGVCRFADGGWTHFFGPSRLPSDMITGLEADADRLYITTLKGLSTVDQLGEFTITTKEPCETNRRRNCPWHTAVPGVAVDDVTADVWLADNGAVHRLGPRRWRHFYTQRGITSRRITGIAASGGRVAVGTIDRGIHFSSDGRRFETIDDQQGLAGNWVMDLRFDRQGRLWAATCTRGVSVRDQDRWRSFGTGDGLVDDYTLSVRDIRGQIWIGTLSGISIYDGRGFTTLTTDQGLSGNEVHDIIEFRDQVVVATDSGLTILAVGQPRNGGFQPSGDGGTD